MDSTGTIQVLVAGDVSDLYERIKIDKCLRLACFELKASKPQFNTTGHSYEVHLTNVSSLCITPTTNLFVPFLTDGPFIYITLLLQLSKVEEIEGDHLPMNVVEYVTLTELEDMPLNKVVSIIAINYGLGPLQHVACRDGSVKPRTNVRLVDDSMRVISLSLWSEHAQIRDETEGRCVKVNNLKLGEFNGKKVLNSTPGTEAIATPLDLTMTEIQTWWNDGAAFETFKEILFQV